MKKIMLRPNADRDIGLTVTNKVAALLDELNEPYFIWTEWDIPKEIIEESKMIIVFGGDGTILHTARMAVHFGVPLLGVNTGGKGFICEVEPEEIDIISKAVAGDYNIDTRMMLDLKVIRDGQTIFSDFALNDVVVGGMVKVIDVTVYGDGEKITSFLGDGVIISTPTGSTAYSMAAGGPIVEPDAENIIITPICAHILAAKSFVLSPKRKVCVELAERDDIKAYMTADGGDSIELFSGDRIEIGNSDLNVKLIRLSDGGFYERVSRKLGDRT